MSSGQAAGGGRPRGERLGSSELPLLAAYDAALYDLDGVLYLGTDPVAHAAESVAAAEASGLRSAFVTNNASRRPAAVAAHLTALGIRADPEDVVTSAQASVRLLRQHLPAGATVLVVGAEGLVAEIAAAGYRPVRQADAHVRAVVQGYGPDTGWHQLAEASIALRAGALWIAANTDSTLPSPRGPLPGNGALVAALQVATGLVPLVAGKPEPTLHLESVGRVGAQRPLVIGDRLDTDVLGAIRGGADSLLVLTGVVDLHEAVTAPAGMRPTYLSQDLRGLLVAHPPVAENALTATCEDAVASYDNGVLRVQGAGLSALRVACSLGWSAADRGLAVTAVEGLEQ